MTRALLLLALLAACNPPTPTPPAPIDTDTDPNPTTPTDPNDTDDTDLPGCEDVAGDNHVRENAIPLVDGGSYRIDSQTPDWFTLDVPANTEVTIDILFTGGDIDARLRSGGVQASGITTSDNEQLVWLNDGNPATAELEVYAFGQDCISYEIQTSFN